MPIDTADQRTAVEFIREATEGLKWMDCELAELKNEGDKAALAGAREELAQMLLVVGEHFRGRWEN